MSTVGSDGTTLHHSYSLFALVLLVLMVLGVIKTGRVVPRAFRKEESFQR